VSWREKQGATFTWEKGEEAGDLFFPGEKNVCKGGERPILIRFEGRWTLVNSGGGNGPGERPGGGRKVIYFHCIRKSLPLLLITKRETFQLLEICGPKEKRESGPRGGSTSSHLISGDDVSRGHLL